jgi:hypothetical protein
MAKRNEQDSAPKGDVQDEGAQDSAPQDAPQEAQGALSVAHLAEQAGVSQKDMRRWLRAQARNAGAGDVLPGKGGRYAFTGEQAALIVAAYGRSKATRGTLAPAAALVAAEPEGEASA